MDQTRQFLPKAKRVVVKVGTHVLVNERGRPHKRRIAAIVDELAALWRDGKEVILVSSGAIGAGIEALDLSRKPNLLPDLQMAASVGQARLISLYTRLLTRRGIVTSQILLTHADLKDRQRHLNTRNTLSSLLKHGVVPIINENDTVAVDEIKFGDNDMLSALVAGLVQADVLLMMTSTNGVYAAPADTTCVPYIEAISKKTFDWVRPAKASLSTGGMEAKLKAAKAAVDLGVPVVIVGGMLRHGIMRVLRGDTIGTLIGQPQKNRLVQRKLWIQHFHRVQGRLVVNRHAVEPLEEKGASLLAVGIVGVEGTFESGSLIEIVTERGRVIAQGLCDYDSRDVTRVMGLKSGEMAKVLGRRDFKAVVHRDNMILH